ncbi:hypothetical protein ACXR2U_16770 [Jatrophihabitans sp. YIM 134969]
MSAPRRPDLRPLDTAPLAEVVDRVLARHPTAATARARAVAITAAADLACSHFAAGGRLVLATAGGPATVTATEATATARRFAHEYGFADGAVLVSTEGAPVRPTPRDAVVTVDDLAGSAGPDVVAALDALATAVAAHLGHLHDDLPVDLVARSDADHERVVTMVGSIAGTDPATAHAAAEAAGFDVRVAVLALAGPLDLGQARLLASSHRTLREALANLPRRPPDPPRPPGADRPVGSDTR